MKPGVVAVFVCVVCVVSPSVDLIGVRAAVVVLTIVAIASILVVVDVICWKYIIDSGSSNGVHAR